MKRSWPVVLGSLCEPVGSGPLVVLMVRSSSSNASKEVRLFDKNNSLLHQNRW